MERWRSRGLVALLAVAMLGLVLVQVAWMRRTLALQEALHASAVTNVLQVVSERIERVDRARTLMRHSEGRQLVHELDSLRQVPGVRKGWPQEQEFLVADLVRDLLARHDQPDVSERLDAALIDSLLAEQFAAHDLGPAPPFAVLDRNGVPLLTNTADAHVLELLSASPYRERLFPSDPNDVSCHLHIWPEPVSNRVLRGMWPVLLAATLSLVLLVLVFVQATRTILRQKRLSDIRNDLVNNLTHELKTPISTIALACEALSDPSLTRTEDQVRKYTAMIRDENKRLGALVENVLQSAVEDSGHMVLKPVELDVHDLVKDVVRNATMQVQRRNGTITTDLKAEAHRVWGDRIHLTNLLYNLVDNAVKYCREEPRIHIATRNDREGVWLSVSDNGIGIPAGEREKIFDRLYRIPTGNVHNAKGYGLGLSYVRAVARRHGGRVELESTPGQGSTFHVCIPYEHHTEPSRTAR
jgi:two-component system phosphate regulon sensor histidine kinase PhoR